MKIAFWHFYTFRLRRGIETLVISLANALAQKGHEVSIVAAKPTVEPLVKPFSAVKVYTYPATKYCEHLSIVPFYTAHFLKHSYDHVVTFFADFGEGHTWNLLHLVKPIPLSLYLCYPYSATSHRYLSFLRLDWHCQAKRVLADAQWIAEEAQELFKRQVSVAPVGADTERFKSNPLLRQRARQKYGYADEDIVLLNVSALERRKGVQRVLEAMSRLKSACPKLKYFILGNGEDEIFLKQMSRKLGLQDRVIFEEETSELEGYYNMADIFVMLPSSEGNSIACHEAMSCELPVIVSKTKGFCESVSEEAGILIDPDNPHNLEQAIQRLANHNDLRKQMGFKGRASIERHATWKHRADHLLKILQ